MNTLMNGHSPALAVLAALMSFAFPAVAQETTPSAAPPGMAGAGMVPGATAPAPAVAFVPGQVIDMRPTEKRPLVMKENERNPYAKRNPHDEVAAEADSDAEELRIRERLASLRVSGRSQGPNGLRVLLGDIILEEGRILPQLLEDQSESLKVVELGADMVVLGWVDTETGNLTGKSMQVAYDLTPSVSYALHGQSGDGEEGVDGAVVRRMGVIRVGEDRKKHEPGMAARESSAGIPPEVFKAGQ
jgi:hypothetical protein